MSAAGFWTPARIATLKTAWLKGDTGTDIAEKLGCTRSAVLGKLGRLGLLKSDRPQSNGADRIRESNMRRWRDPEIRARLLARINDPEVKRKAALTRAAKRNRSVPIQSEGRA
jgi:hypothetical protein